MFLSNNFNPEKDTLIVNIDAQSITDRGNAMSHFFALNSATSLVQNAVSNLVNELVAMSVHRVMLLWRRSLSVGTLPAFRAIFRSV